eukprot:CAMPEP_0195070078 /NCGR_PEP_ID=MMETSP0448-20130528/14220_1 /TAXON_ID=66468 /ORGANISM="Heterocapsa triquestra, Strain CCMP 448" /LENGTH=60 /DNA_ID=CAMNT_0040101743 /DNA_START=106 /DNA_END=285 /DNA_ORIENTATION=+
MPSATAAEASTAGPEPGGWPPLPKPRLQGQGHRVAAAHDSSNWKRVARPKALQANPHRLR